jgi:catechol 1,2-dioxygenase
MDTRIDRRTALGWLAGTVAASLWSGNARAQGREAGCRPTRPDAAGPFYLPGAPYRVSIAPPAEPGTRLIIRGRVLAPDCTTPLGGAVLDVWQADAGGSYHDDRLRGRIRTDAQGRYELHSIRPGAYRIGDRHRPAHIHVTVSREGSRPLTTQLYFTGDPYLAPNDACGRACRSDDPDRIIPLRAEERMGAEFLTGLFDIVLEPAS